MALTAQDKAFLDKQKAKGLPFEEAWAKLSAVKEKLGLTGGTFATRAASFAESATPRATESTLDKAAEVKAQGTDFAKEEPYQAQKLIDLPYSGKPGIGVNPLAPVLNTLEAAKDSGKDLLEGGKEMFKKYAPAVQPGLGALPGFGPEDQKEEDYAGENFTDVVSGALGTAFAPISGTLTSLPGGEKVAELLNKPREWVGDLAEVLAQKAGVDTASEDFQAAKNQIMTAFDVANVAYGPKVAEKASPWLKEKLSSVKDTAQSSKVQNIVSNRVAELEKLENQNSIVRKAIEEASSKDVDVKQIVSETDLLKDAVDKDGRIRTTQDGGAVDQLQEFIKPQEEVIAKVLEQEGKTIPLKELKTKLQEGINGSELKGKNKLNALKAVDEEIDGLGLDADELGNISLSDLQKAKIDKYRNADYSNPASKATDKKIAKVYKEIIEDLTESVDVRKLNQELLQYFAVLKFLEKLDGKVVKGGKMGKYFGNVIGGMVGSHFGPLGTFIGSEIGGSIQGRIMKNTFSGETGKVLEPSETMKSAIDQSNK